MHIPSTFKPRKSEVLTESDLEDLGHLEFAERLRKTLYYGKVPSTDRPSLPMTELAVDFFRDASPKQLGRVDTYWASSVGRRACVSPCSMMLGMMYIERLKHRNLEYLQNTSSSDLFLISMMVASKYLYDEGVDEEVFNDEWAESAKIEVDEINDMERDFLAAIDWSVFVKADEFWTALTAMEQRIALKEGVDRGFFTYTDVMVLSYKVNSAAVKHALAQLCKLVLVCSVTYTAGVLVLVGSVATLSCMKSCAPASLPDLPHTPASLPDLPHTTASLPDLPHTPESVSPNNMALVGSNESHLHADLPFVPDSFSPAMTGSNESFLPDDVTMDIVNDVVVETGLDMNNNEAVHKAYVPFSGLLTLTLIQDTVMFFLKGVSESHYSRYRSRHMPSTRDETNDDLLCGDGVCTCGSDVDDEIQDCGMLGCAACGKDEGRLVGDRCCHNGVRCGSCCECRHWSARQKTGCRRGIGNVVCRLKVASPPFADVTVGFHTAPPPVVATAG
ncbi:Protein CNPPD1 [Lamellibrachia satsuma]|nr:Protein CNPPD1 [Lamellibrachia satsuma]